MPTNKPPRGRDHYKGHPNGTRIVVYVLMALALAIIIAISTVTLVKGASASNLCERHRMVKVYTHGGRSWRCKRVRYAALRNSSATIRCMTGTVVTSELPTNASAAVPLIRTVRTVPITHGVTPNERVDRAFDKVLIFPVVDEP